MMRNVLLGALALAACTATPSQLAGDFNLLSNGLAGAVTVLQTDGTLPAATSAKIIADLATVQSIATMVQNATAGVSSAPTVSQLVTAANKLTADLSALPNLPAQLHTAIAAADVLLPIIESEAGLVAASAAAPGVAMTPAAARGELRRAAAGTP
jgi:hypothetical protein